MPNYEDEITDFAPGDYKEVLRTLTGIDPADPLETVYLTAKPAYKPGETDDSSALFKKIITTNFQVGVGQILSDGSEEVGLFGITYPAGTGRVLFILLPEDTIKMKKIKPPFDIQCVTVSGKPYTSNGGNLIPNGKAITLVP